MALHVQHRKGCSPEAQGMSRDESTPGAVDETAASPEIRAGALAIIETLASLRGDWSLAA